MEPTDTFDTTVPTVDRRVAEPVMPEPVGAIPATALGTLTRTELDVQITTARRFPRSLALFKQTCLSLVRLDQATAAACFYALPRRQRQDDGTFKRVTITGPSIRLAEIVASAWGNLRAGARIIDVQGGEVVAQGYAHDLQSNYAVVTETRRRIVDRNGRRYPDDMVVMTQNAACAIARRNATFAVVPRAYVNQLVVVAQKVAAGDETTLVDSRREVLASFAELGVPPGRVCDKLERPGLSDLDLDDVALLRGLLTAIRDGETTVAAEFSPPAGDAVTPATRSAALTDTVRRRRRAQDAPAAPSGGGPGDSPSPTADAPQTKPADVPDGDPQP